MTLRQGSQLLPHLLEQLGDDRRRHVLHIGPALPETLEFFAGQRCKLYFVDPFAEFPLVADLEANASLRDRVRAAFDLPAGVRFDLCLFWDCLNYLGEEALGMLGDQLREHVTDQTLAHGFAVHNLRSPQRDCTFSIVAPDSLCVRERRQPLRGYQPLPQQRLQTALACLQMQRSVLLADGRLEMLLSARA